MQYLKRMPVTAVMKGANESIKDNLGRIPHYVADISMLFKYGVRSKYEPYGATAYFDVSKRPIAVWWDFGNKLVRPGDADWDHAKTVAKSSLITVITALDHLAHVHLIISNGMQLACREALGPLHPLRRLLKPHFFNTATINSAAKDSLIPVHGIAYKVFGMNAQSWEPVLYDSLRAYKYQTFPSFIADKGMSQEELQQFPLAVDGINFWNVIKKYVKAYLDIFYPDEVSLQADVELQDYWLHYRDRQVEFDLGIPHN